MSIETSKTETDKNKHCKKKKKNRIYKNYRRTTNVTYMYWEYQRRGKRKEETPEATVTENFPKLMLDTNQWIRKLREHSAR